MRYIVLKIEVIELNFRFLGRNEMENDVSIKEFCEYPVYRVSESYEKIFGIEKAIDDVGSELNYLINSKNPFDSPVDVAFALASSTYLLEEKNSFEIEKLYRTALDLAKDTGNCNSKKDITDLDMFAFFTFIVKQEHGRNLHLIDEFHSEEVEGDGNDWISSVVRKFLIYFGYSDDSSAFELLMDVASTIVEDKESIDQIFTLYEDGLPVRDEYSLDDIVYDFFELVNF